MQVFYAKESSLMRKVLIAALLISAAVMMAAPAWSWDAGGKIYGTELEYSGLAVTKNGVEVRLTNSSDTDVKVSLKIVFYDNGGNSIGYTIFAVREIPGGSFVDISRNYLNGKWKPCRDAPRMEWQRMTYELLY
jgi:hypothetical protein